MFEYKVEITIQPKESVIVIGSGTSAIECVKIIRELHDGCIYVFEGKYTKISLLEKECSKLENVIYNIVSEHILDDILKIHAKVIISVNNVYIFNDSLIDKYFIINYHNAILPRHAGRYAEAWAIYMQDEETGVTWHIVSKKVDSGDIIYQEKMKMSENLTAIKLIALQTRLAVRLFHKLFLDLISGNGIIVYKQAIRTVSERHFSWEKPNQGVLDLNWTAEKISAFLRAMDYGSLAMLGSPVVKYQNQVFIWDKYKINKISSKKQGIYLKNNILFIFKEEYEIILYGIKILRS